MPNLKFPLSGAHVAASRRTPSGGAALGVEFLVVLRALINRDGLGRAAARVGLPRATVAAAAAGGGLRTATRLVLADRLQRAETVR